MAHNELQEEAADKNKMTSSDHSSGKYRDLDAKFDAAVRVIQTIPNSSFQPSRELALRFYGLYKRATNGLCTASKDKPAFYEVEKTLKWNAHREAEKMTEDEAKEEYVKELQKIVEMMSLTPEVSDFLDKLGSFYEMVNSSDEETSALVTAKTSQLGTTLQDFRTLHSAELTGRKTNGNTTKSDPAPLLQDILAAINSDDSVIDRTEDSSDEEEDMEDDSHTVESGDTELSFHDADSLSEWSETQPAAGRSTVQNPAKTVEVISTLLPELESLKRRTDRAERTFGSHGERLLTTELKLDNLSKEVSKLSLVIRANVGRANGNVDQHGDSVLDKNFHFVTSKILHMIEVLPMGKLLVPIFGFYWRMLEGFVRRRPFTAIIIFQVVWPSLFQLLSRLTAAMYRRLV